jgi:uncharacterized membrane protein HdeD (DUF308 family)
MLEGDGQLLLSTDRSSPPAVPISLIACQPAGRAPARWQRNLPLFTTYPACCDMRAWHWPCTTSDQRRRFGPREVQGCTDSQERDAMSSQTLTADGFAGGKIEGSFRGWVIFTGVTLLVLGTAAVIYDTTATIASVVLFGSLLMIAGFVQIVHAFQVSTWSGFFLYLLDGILRATVGTLLVLYPGSGALTLTLVLSFYFIAGGLFRTFGSIVLQFPSWGWSVASGLVSVALGVMLAMQWPTSGTWFIGFAVGLDLIFTGWALLMFATAVKKLSTSYA